MEVVGTSRPYGGKLPNLNGSTNNGGTLYNSHSSPSRSLSKRTTFSHMSPLPQTGDADLTGVTPIDEEMTKWTREHVGKMMDELIQTKEGRRQQEAQNRQEVALLARRIPVDILAREWLNKERVSLKNRAYLIEKLLPYVVMGVESVLMEAARRNCVEPTKNVNFNPLNFLASYLMRNNPKFSNFSEASPYIRGLRSVSKELQQEMFQFADNKLAKLKVAAKEKREKRQKEEEEKRQEQNRRNGALQQLFDEFLVINETRVDVLTIRSAVRSFTDILSRLPKEVADSLRVMFDFELSESDVGKKFSRKELNEYLQLFTDVMDNASFDRFVQHLVRCGRTYRAAMEKEERKQLLSRLFMSCDTEQIGTLDRKRILSLFDQFYKKLSENAKRMLRNPQKWPVREVSELKLEPTESDNEEMEEELPHVDPETFEFALELVDLSINQAMKQIEEEASEVALNAKKVIEADRKSDASSVTELQQETVDEIEIVNEPETVVVVGDEDTTSRHSKAASTHEGDAESEADVHDILVNEGNRSAAVSINSAGSRSSMKHVSPREEFAAAGGQMSDAHIKTVTMQEEKIQDVVESGPAEAPAQQNEAGEKKTQNVSFTVDTKIKTPTREETGFTVKSLEPEPTQASSFSDENVDVGQFIHMTESFLGDAPDRRILEQLVDFVRDGYEETEEERLERVKRAHRQALSAKRKWTISILFDKWDNDGSGYLEFDEVETLLIKYKGGSYTPGVVTAKNQLRPAGKKRRRKVDSHLTKSEFHAFLYAVIAAMDDDEGFEALLNYLIQSVERSQAEKIRGMARKKWLGHIVYAGYVCGGVLDPVYRAVFQALYKDAETHGDSKIISATLSLLETNDLHPERGEVLLRNVAATQDCAPVVVGRILYQDMPNVSFQVVESGNPLHLPRIGPNSALTFWNPETQQEGKEGAFVVIPLKDRMKRVFGTLNVDTLNDPRSKVVFFSHEILFYQGVAKAFSMAFHFVEIQRRTLHVAESALSWICRRSPAVQGVTYYMVERDPRPQMAYVLRKMMQVDARGDATIFPNPPKLERRDNLFRAYLFKTIDTSESTSEDAYGERHLAFPLRAHDGAAVAVIDINIGELRSLHNTEMKEIQKLLRLLQEAYIQIVHIILGPSAVGKPEDTESSTTLEDVELMFDRLMLEDLKEMVARMDAQSYAELRSYKIPPPTVHKIIQAVLALFYPEMSVEGTFQNWEKCKKYVNVELGRKIVTFDPHEESGGVDVEAVLKHLNDVPHHTVDKHGSKPAQQLYSWLFVCISLIEHTRKLRRSQLPEKVPEPKEDAVTAEGAEHAEGEEPISAVNPKTPSPVKELDEEANHGEGQ